MRERKRERERDWERDTDIWILCNIPIYLVRVGELTRRVNP